MPVNGQLTIIIVADIILGPNGVRTVCKSFVDWSQRTEGVRVILLTPTRDATTSDITNSDEIGIRPLAQLPNPIYPGLILGFYSQPQLRRIVEAISGQKVIHIGSPGFLGVCAAKVARSLNVPTVGCYHMDTLRCCVKPYLRLRGRLARGVAHFLDRRAYGECRALCAPSKSAATAAEDFYQSDVEVIPNPIDVNKFRPATDRKGAFRDKYASDGKVLVVVIGRVAREKNVDLICEHLLHDDRINTVFVGDGPSCEQLRNQWGATITGFLTGDDLTDAYQQADVFVQLSVLETFGLTLAEAMASGLPAVVLESGGFAASIPPGHGVEVLTEDELPDLADRVVALATNKQLHEQAAVAARLYVERLSPDVIFPKLVDFHRAVLHDHSDVAEQ